MNRLLTLFLSIFFASNSSAQLITISETNQLPSIGDTIHYVNANPFGFDPIGTGPVTNKLWDQTGLFLTGTSYDFYYIDPTTIPANMGKDSFPSANIARGESGAPGYFYYQNTSTEVKRLGWFSSASNFGIYENGSFAKEFQFPITAGQTFNSSYNGRYSPFNVGEDSVKIESGIVTINADMQGTLMLPNSTFTDVLRVHVIENFHIKIYMLGLPIIDYLIEDDYTYWFNDSIQQPLLVSGVTTVDGTPEPQVLRFQPISTPTGIAENNTEFFSISPNPSAGKFTVSSFDRNQKTLKLEVTDLTGKIIFTEQTRSSGLLSVDISSYPKGIYLVKIYNGEHQSIKKIIVQ
ncbi:MAG: T9SS type A sorting domain-containing protein [Bacteroidetes bacterium]|nr:T9SS type A sorting domain-containing protein [Bacteroidota bacterium]